jgi:hypothetical protein
MSFKLETDETKLEQKALASFKKYNVDYVLANLL